MKNIVSVSIQLTLSDVNQSLKNGWTLGVYKGRLCLENEKTIFKPASMPKP